MNRLETSALLFTLATLLFSNVYALPSGAPVGTCVSMAPDENKHGAPPQTGDPPYVIQVDKSYYGSNSTVKVYIKACGDAAIGGFLIEAREKGQTKALGSFNVIPPDTKTLNCDGADSTQAAVTHSKVLSVKMLHFEWRPVAATMATENIYFVATVAQDRLKYWLGIKSVELEMETPNKTYVAPNNPMCPSGNDGKDGNDMKDGDDGNSASSATFSVILILLAVSAKFFV